MKHAHISPNPLNERPHARNSETSETSEPLSRQHTSRKILIFDISNRHSGAVISSPKSSASASPTWWTSDARGLCEELRSLAVQQLPAAFDVPTEIHDGDMPRHVKLKQPDSVAMA